MHYLDRAIVIVLKTKRTYFVTPSVNSTPFLQFGQNMLSKSELLSLSGCILLILSLDFPSFPGISLVFVGASDIFLRIKSIFYDVLWATTTYLVTC